MAIIREALTTYFAILMILGIPGNSLILAIYSTYKKKTGTDILVMGMASVDLFSSLFLFAKLRPWVAASGYCQFQFFFTGLIILSQLSLTLAIGIDRYMAVCHPVNRRPSKRIAAAAIVVGIMVPAGVMTPGIFVTIYEPLIKDCIYRADAGLWFTIIDQYIIQSLLIGASLVSAVIYTRIVVALHRQVKVRALMVPEATSVGPRRTEAGTGLHSNMEPSTSFPVVETDCIPGVATNPKCAWGELPQELQGVTYNARPKAQASLNTTRNAHTSNMEFLSSGNNASKESRRPDDGTLGSSMGPHQPSTISGVARPLPAPGQPGGRPAEHRLTMMLACITVIYFLSLVPSIVGRFVPLETRVAFMSRSDIHHTVYAMFFRLFQINNSINFFVYWLVNRRFRRTGKEMMMKIKRTVLKLH